MSISEEASRIPEKESLCLFREDAEKIAHKVIYQIRDNEQVECLLSMKTQSTFLKNIPWHKRMFKRCFVITEINVDKLFAFSPDLIELSKKLLKKGYGVKVKWSQHHYYTPRLCYVVSR